ncbi:alpha-2-macroglobulin-like protein 1 isoform X2 [Danio rerio]|uniref:Alpha-2-macroglobulin-like protein 1 isoform X2 n=1 Tax=Danio rerio TaxID=7955 RepID=A0A8M3AST6_DANRE|nr:alpha-2-macroglobulin-like protein 1 isoform X2 [Danio rerio]|eukprot:XP_009289985.1 alpha-2-macroglobulin-like protein 1 isoform X2 [Danio rerio]
MMALIHKRGLLITCFLLFVSQGTSKPNFMVTFPAIIRSGSEAKLCMSLLKPEKNLQLTITLVSSNQNRTLLQEKTEKEFHRCLDFQAPESASVQEIYVEAQGKYTHLIEKRKVKFVSHNPLTLIKTDKPIYNPGKTVQFRIFTIDFDFKPVDETYKLIAIQDNRGNRINQWINATSTHGKILQLSHSLNPEASVGLYELSVETNKGKFLEFFQVKEYVLPKFEVKIHKPKLVRGNEKEVKLGVCGRYTHGRPVLGRVKMTLCSSRIINSYFGSHYQIPFCVTGSAVLNKTGCAFEMFPLSSFIQKSVVEYITSQSLEFTASITEEGTGITEGGTEKVTLSYIIGTVKFIDVPDFYEEGSVIKAKVKVELFNGQPVSNIKLVVYVPSGIGELITDINGLANFTIDTSFGIGTTLILTASLLSTPEFVPFSFDSAHKTLQKKPKQDSFNKSQLDIKALEEPLKCGVEISVTVQYTIARETAESVTIVYLVLSRAQIVSHGYESIELKGSDRVVKGEVTFKVPFRSRMAPEIQFLAYCVLPSENVLAASKTFQTEKCFENKVSLRFSPTTAVPGEENTLQLSAQPGSLCGISAVDQSVLILESGQRLDADKVFKMLPTMTFTYDVEDQMECLKFRSKRSLRFMPAISQYGAVPSYHNMYPPLSGSTGDAVFETFKNMGLKVATNLVIRIPHCIKFRDVLFQRAYGGYGVGFGYGAVPRGIDPPAIPALAGAPGAGALIPARGGVVAEAERLIPSPLPTLSISLLPEETIRTFFPETWIWEIVEVGDSGSAEVPVTVPDTITSWATEAFCLSSTGLGLAPPAKLIVFQPFFLELSLPYSIVRGEIFELKATVFNYQSKCIMVKVSPAPSSDYTLKASSDDQYSSCLCANGRKTFKWILTPSVLGVVNVTVSAEAEASQTVCDNEIVSVPERGRIDTVTRSLRVNAEGIEKTKSHSWLLCPKGQNHLEEVELAFPQNVIEGSGRATVSVLGDLLGRALKNLDGLLRMPYGCGEQNIAVLSPNIYILQYLENTNQLTSAIRERASGFLKSGYQRQLNYLNLDGSYTTFGQGEGNTWLTAFVLRTFGKAQDYIFIDPPKIEKSKEWLVSHQRPDGSYQIKGKLFNNRMKGGVSDSVTITAYITASLLELNIPVTDPAVSKGLSHLKQYAGDIRNLYTSALLSYTFSLAKDKEVRDSLLNKLKNIAISEGPLVHWSQSASADDSDSLDVEISSYVLLAVLTADSLTTADLGFANRIVSWLVKQQNAYGGFSSTQDTVVALQALSLYATKVFSSDGSSTVTVQSAGDSHHFDVNQDNKLLYQEKQLANVPGKYSIEVKGSACVSVQVCEVQQNLKHGYKGIQYIETSNMIIVDMKLLSGFSAEPIFMDEVKKAVSRVESSDEHIIVYLNEIRNNINYRLPFRIKRIFSVKNLKPAVIKVYDYYQTSERAEAEYTNHCA